MVISLYSWKARNLDGKVFEGTLTADSENEAAVLLKQQYACIVYLKKQHQLYFKTSILHTKGRFTDKQRVIFFKQLAVILNSGIPLLQGIELLQYRLDKDVGKVCLEVKTDLYSGCSLSRAMSRQKSFFPELAVTLVAAGEVSGQLNQVLLETANYYEKQYVLKNFLYKSAVYPMLLMAVSLAVMLFFLFYVLPVLAETYQTMQVKPGQFLDNVLIVNAFISEYFFMLIFLLAAAVTWLYNKRSLLAEKFLYLPWVSRIYGMLAEVRFCKLLALLLNSGINITDAVSEAGKIFHDHTRKTELYLFNKALQRGTDIGNAARSAGRMFSPLTIEFIAVGSATGNLPQMLMEAAKISEQDLKDKLERFKEVFSPCLLLISALMTAAVVCAVMGPLFDLFSVLPE